MLDLEVMAEFSLPWYLVGKNSGLHFNKLTKPSKVVEKAMCSLGQTLPGV